MEECEKVFKDIFSRCADIVIEPFETPRGKAMIIYIDGLVDKNMVDRDIVKPLKSPGFSGDITMTLESPFKECTDVPGVTREVLRGNVACFYGKCEIVRILEFREFQTRGVQEPDAEGVIRGPKEAFTESIRTNTSMIRRKLKISSLKIENYTMGRQSHTTVSLVYIDGIVNQEVLKEVKHRFQKINVGVIFETGEIEQYIDENTFSPVSGIGLTQKPDVLAQRLTEGRVGVFCDGTPHALTIPSLFIENLHTSSDYYNRVLYSSFIRILRSIGLLITVMLPGLSVAVISYHQEMIPSAFLTSIISTTLKTPMPVGIEVFLLTIMFEMLREAGTRLPKAIGSAITIVGSLIIGDAAVNAGIVSAPIVIIVALTAVTGFMVPSLAEFTVVYRGLFWLLGSTMGLVGIGSGMVIMLTQLASADSFGIPILSGFDKTGRKDGVIRFPLWGMIYRPDVLVKDNRRRKVKPR